MIQQTSGGVTCEKTLDTMTLILEKTQMLNVVQSMKVASTLTFSIRFGSLSKKEPLDNQSKHHPNITACNIRLGGAALLPVTCSWNDLGRQTLSVFNNSILISNIPTIQGQIHTMFSLSSVHWWSLLQGIEFLCLKFGLQAHFWRMKPSKMEASSPCLEWQNIQKWAAASGKWAAAAQKMYKTTQAWKVPQGAGAQWPSSVNLERATGWPYWRT